MHHRIVSIFIDRRIISLCVWGGSSIQMWNILNIRRRIISLRTKFLDRRLIWSVGQTTNRQWRISRGPLAFGLSKRNKTIATIRTIFRWSCLRGAILNPFFYTFFLLKKLTGVMNFCGETCGRLKARRQKSSLVLPFGWLFMILNEKSRTNMMKIELGNNNFGL